MVEKKKKDYADPLLIVYGDNEDIIHSAEWQFDTELPHEGNTALSLESLSDGEFELK